MGKPATLAEMRCLSRKSLPIALRRLRGNVASVLLVFMILLVAVVRPFAGTAILLHDHHDLGSHTHAAPMMAIAGASGAWHADHHEDEPGFPANENGGYSIEDTGGTVISVTTDPHLPARQAATPVDLRFKSLATVASWILLVPPYVGPEPGSPGGGVSSSPCHLCSLTAGDRLVATSRALLI
jgi:hypothetical protein